MLVGMHAERLLVMELAVELQVQSATQSGVRLDMESAVQSV